MWWQKLLDPMIHMEWVWSRVDRIVRFQSHQLEKKYCFFKIQFLSWQTSILIIQNSSVVECNQNRRIIQILCQRLLTLLHSETKTEISLDWLSLIIILVSLTMHRHDVVKKIFTYTWCISGFMASLHKIFWTDSSHSHMLSYSMFEIDSW